MQAAITSIVKEPRCHLALDNSLRRMRMQQSSKAIQTPLFFLYWTAAISAEKRKPASALSFLPTNKDDGDAR